MPDDNIVRFFSVARLFLPFSLSTYPLPCPHHTQHTQHTGHRAPTRPSSQSGTGRTPPLRLYTKWRGVYWTPGKPRPFLAEWLLPSPEDGFGWILPLL